MNIKAFFVDALGGALECGIGNPDDVLRHVTPEVLAKYLPRPLWARLLTACLGASRVDALLIIETIGVPNLCEHVPGAIIWACIAEIGARSLGQTYKAEVAPTAVTAPIVPLTRPPPDVDVRAAPAAPPASVGPSIPPVNEPLADLITELEQDERPIPPARARTPTAQRFRQSNTGLGRLGGANPPPQARRPQAQAAPTPPPITPARAARRVPTEVSEIESETDSEWRTKEPLAVDDSQLVDWQSAEETATNGDDFSDLSRKR